MSGTNYAVNLKCFPLYFFQQMRDNNRYLTSCNAQQSFLVQQNRFSSSLLFFATPLSENTYGWMSSSSFSSYSPNWVRTQNLCPTQYPTWRKNIAKKRWRLKYTRSALQLKVSVPNPKFGPGYNILQKFTQMCSSQIWLQYFAKMHRCCCLRLIILPRRIVSVIQALSVTVTSVRVTIRLQCQLFVPKRIFLSWK